MSTVNREARAELTRAVAERYRGSSKDEKTLILNEFVRLTGYHRKHALRVLRKRVPTRTPRGVSRPCVYDEAVRQVLVVLWEASDRICGKRLRSWSAVKRTARKAPKAMEIRVRTVRRRFRQRLRHAMR